MNVGTAACLYCYDDSLDICRTLNNQKLIALEIFHKLQYKYGRQLI